MTIEIKQWTLKLVRITLGIVFLWFGILKVLDLSPVASMVTQVYNFLPQPLTFTIIGWLEILIGIGFLFNIFLRATIVLFWLQMAGVFLSLVLMPSLFFINANPFLITIEGEFIVKNIVYISASILLFTAHREKTISA
jgi:putative oxidoreductase